MSRAIIRPFAGDWIAEKNMRSTVSKVYVSLMRYSSASAMASALSSSATIVNHSTFPATQKFFSSKAEFAGLMRVTRIAERRVSECVGEAATLVAVSKSQIFWSTLRRMSGVSASATGVAKCTAPGETGSDVSDVPESLMVSVGWLHQHLTDRNVKNRGISQSSRLYSTVPEQQIPLGRAVEDIAEGELLRWYAPEGDDVHELQPLSNDKARDKASVTSPSVSGKQPMQVKLKVLKGKQHGLHDRLIPRSTWRVLDNLHDAGYETYLVGGCVRDLLLEQVPKDFDVLSTAEPDQVKRSFPGRCFIVGRRFPICHVYSKNTIIEVSSFSTQLRTKKKGESVKPKRLTSNDVAVKGTEGWDERDFARWENSMKRDFTINGLMYDPFKRLVYDYVGGLRDLKKFKVRTVIPAEESFAEDSARILRAIRIAARLGFSFTRSTARAIKDQRFSLLKLNKGRLMLEANMFFAYGASEPSVRLMWRYGVLELLLPLQAAHFVEMNFRRRDEGSNFLLDLFRNLDKVVAPDRPCHGSLWVALLAFHLATTESMCSPVVIGAAALTVYHTTNRRKAAEKALRIHAKLHNRNASFEGQVEDGDLASVSSESVLDEATLLVEKAKACLNRMMDASVTTQVMQELTGAEPEDLLAVAQAYSQKAYSLFRGATRDELGDVNLKQKHEALRRENGKRSPPDAEAITRGDIEAISYLFSRIVLNTLYPREVAKS